MKRKALTFLMILVLVIGLLAVNAGAETETLQPDHPHTADSAHCSCGDATKTLTDHTHADITWSAWTNGMTTPTSGSYYLSEDVTITGAISLSGNFRLCLNGYTLTVEGGARAFTYVGTAYRLLEICDCSTTQTGKITVCNSKNQGGVVYIGRGKFCLYGGTLENTAESGTMVGGVVRVGQAGDTTDKSVAFWMYGGTLTGGAATSGGCVYVGDTANATVQLLGGTVQNGTATGNGGNICVTSGKLSLRGTAVTGGIAEGNGGNIHCTASLTMTGGSVRGGKASATNGDNVRLQSGAAMTMTGGTIGENTQTAQNPGHNISILNANFTMSGGTVKGLVRANATGASVIELSGKAKITGSAENLLLCNTDKVALSIGTLDDTAVIGISLADGVSLQKFATATEDPAGLVDSDVAFYDVAYSEGYLSIAEASVYCPCLGKTPDGHTCQQITWQGWGADEDEKTKLPTSGYYYLTSDVEVSAVTIVPADSTLYLDLNGYNVTGTATRAFTVNTGRSLVLTDSGHLDGDELVYSQGIRLDTTDQALVLLNGGAFEMYGGTLKVRSTTKTGQNGMVVRLVNAASSFNMYGGTVDATLETAEGTEAANGAAVYFNAGATMNMYGGTVIGGTVTGNGGAVYLGSSGNLNVYGGIITGGTAVTGGNIYQVSGKLNVYASGLLTDGNAGEGGNFYQKNGYAWIYGTVSGGTAEVGGNIYKYAGTMCLYDCDVVDARDGGGVYAASALTLGDGVRIVTNVNDEIAQNLYLAQGVVLSAGARKLNADANVGVSLEVGKGEFANAVDYFEEGVTPDQVFFSQDSAYGVYHNEEAGTLELKAYAARVYHAEDSTRYYTLEEALEDADIRYLKLMADYEGNVVLSQDLYLDLAGYSILGVVTMQDGAVLYGMDSATDLYDCTNGYGTIESVVGTVAANHKTDVTGSVKRYLTVNEEGVVSFHRFYLGITKMSLRPGVTGVGYKAVFAGDEKVLGMLDQNDAFGFNLWLDGTGKVVTALSSADKFVSGREVSLRLENFDVANYGETAVNANVYLKLANGTVIESAEYSYTLRSLLETVDQMTESFGSEQMSALQQMCSKFAAVMEKWSIDNIRNWSAE